MVSDLVGLAPAVFLTTQTSMPLVNLIHTDFTRDVGRFDSRAESTCRIS